MLASGSIIRSTFNWKGVGVGVLDQEPAEDPRCLGGPADLYTSDLEKELSTQRLMAGYFDTQVPVSLISKCDAYRRVAKSPSRVRTPALTHGTFELFETSAITRYVDRAFQGPPLQPKDTRAVARMDQVMGVIDAYAYWPMVRQVASHAFFRPFIGEPSLCEEVGLGMEASAKVLGFLNGVAEEGAVLSGREITLADCHFAPMVDFFVRAEEGRDILLRHHALQGWWDQLSGWDALRATDPFADQSPEK